MASSPGGHLWDTVTRIRKSHLMGRFRQIGLTLFQPRKILIKTKAKSQKPKETSPEILKYFAFPEMEQPPKDDQANLGKAIDPKNIKRTPGDDKKMR